MYKWKNGRRREKEMRAKWRSINIDYQDIIEIEYILKFHIKPIALENISINVFTMCPTPLSSSSHLCCFLCISSCFSLPVRPLRSLLLSCHCHESLYIFHSHSLCQANHPHCKAKSSTRSGYCKSGKLLAVIYVKIDIFIQF